MTDSDYAYGLVLLANAPAQAESLLHSLEQTVGGIYLYVNVNKTEHTCFKRDGAIPSHSGRPLKSVDKFTHLGSNISSIESNVNMYLAKVWTSVNRLSIIWKSDLSDNIKRDFFSK